MVEVPVPDVPVEDPVPILLPEVPVGSMVEVTVPDVPVEDPVPILLPEVPVPVLVAEDSVEDEPVAPLVVD